MPLPDKTTPTVSVVKPIYDYLKKQKENQKFIRSLEIGGAFVLVSFFLIFAIMPTATAISTLLGDIKSKEIMVKTLKTKINNVIVAQDTFSQIQSQYALLNTALPDSPDYYGSANQIAGVLSENGVTPDRISFDLNFKKDTSSNLPADIKSYTVTFPLLTDFPKSKSIISGLINNRKASYLPTTTFSLQETDVGNKLKLNVVATYYYWEPDL